MHEVRGFAIVWKLATCQSLLIETHLTPHVSGRRDRVQRNLALADLNATTRQLQRLESRAEERLEGEMGVASEATLSAAL